MYLYLYLISIIWCSIEFYISLKHAMTVRRVKVEKHQNSIWIIYSNCSMLIMMAISCHWNLLILHLSRMQNDVKLPVELRRKWVYVCEKRMLVVPSVNNVIFHSSFIVVKKVSCISLKINALKKVFCLSNVYQLRSRTRWTVSDLERR